MGSAVSSPARLLAAALVLVGAATASAQDATPTEASEDREARMLYQAGVEALQAGRHENALDYFQRSYELSGRPELLHNIGITADRLRRDDVALDAFRRFLEAVPDAPNRGDVEARIAALEAAQARNAPPDPEPTLEPEAASEPASEPAGSDPTGWVLLGAGAALVVAGAVLWGVGAADAATVEGAAPGTPWSELQGPYERAPILSVSGAITLAVGAGLAAVGLVVALGQGDDAPAVAFGPGFVTLRGAL